MTFSIFEVTPVLDTAGYADNDVMFVPIEVPQVFDKGVPRKLVSAIVLDGDDQDVDFDLVFFDADAIIGTINQSTDANDLINSWLYKLDNVNQIMHSPTGSLWVAGIVRSNTPSYTAAGMKIKLGFD